MLNFNFNFNVFSIFILKYLKPQGTPTPYPCDTLLVNSNLNQSRCHSAFLTHSPMCYCYHSTLHLDSVLSHFYLSHTISIYYGYSRPGDSLICVMQL